MNLENFKQRPGISILLLYLPFILFSFLEPMHWMNSRPINGGQFYIALVVIGFLFGTPLVLSLLLLIKWAKSSFLVKIAMFLLLAYGASIMRISIVQSRKIVEVRTNGISAIGELVKVKNIGRFKQLTYKYQVNNMEYYRVIDDWNNQYSENDKLLAFKVSKTDPKVNLIETTELI